MIHLRPETVSDRPATRALLVEAFGSPAEADLVERLRAEGDVAVALIAAEGDRIVGHLVLSRMRAPDRALALAPLAVGGAFRNRGIGSELVRVAQAAARARNASAIFVLGDPDYYGRFGFSAEAAAGYRSPYAGPHFMAAHLGGSRVGPGEAVHAPAFAALG